MALSTQQEIALFDIIDVPWQPVVNKLVDENYLFIEKTSAIGSVRQAKSEITQYLLTYVYTNADAEAYLKDLINRWLALGTDAMVMTDGTVGSVSGVTDDPDRERLLIRQRVLNMVPFYKRHEEIMRFASEGTAYIPITR